MSPSSLTGVPELDGHIMRAVEALTAAALDTYTNPAGMAERYDFGEVACRVLAAVAANLGGVEALLAGRPGSWEAEYVRQIVTSTVLEEDLLSCRTLPVRLVLDPYVVLVDLGVVDLLYEQDRTTVETQFGSDDITEEQAEEIDRQVTAVDELFEADLSAYAAAYTETVRRVASERGVTVPVEVDIVSDDSGEPWWDTLAAELHEQARARTPLPTSGTAPKDYPAGQLPGDVDRAAGRTYTARLTGPAGDEGEPR
jgi:hypothetical protein